MRNSSIPKKNKTGKFLLLVVASFFAILFFYPLFLSLMSSLKSNAEILRNPVGFPKKINFSNFIYLFRNTQFARALLNSVVLTVSSELLIIMIIPMAAYGISRHKSKLTVAIYLFFITGLMLPFQAYMIPLFRQLKFFGLYGNMVGPIVVYIAGSSAFGVLLFTGFLNGIPVDIEESARIDGANAFRTFWQIVFPLLKPVTVTLVVLNGMAIWNDFLLPFLVLPSDGARTVNVQIFSFVDQYASRWDIVFAGTISAIIPTLVVFLSLQKYFVKGITAGSTKG